MSELKFLQVNKKFFKLSKKVISLMNENEIKQLNKLIIQYNNLDKKFKAAEEKYAIVSRKNQNHKSLPKLADEGFKYNYLGSKAAQKIHNYIDKLKKKYN